MLKSRRVGRLVRSMSEDVADSFYRVHDKHLSRRLSNLYSKNTYWTFQRFDEVALLILESHIC